MYDLETFEVKKTIDSQEVYYFLDSIMTKIKVIYEPLIRWYDNCVWTGNNEMFLDGTDLIFLNNNYL